MSIKSSYSKDALNYFDKGSNEKEDISKRLKKIVILCLFLYIMKNPHMDPQFFIKQQKKNTIYYEEINNYINVNIFCMY